MNIKIRPGTDCGRTDFDRSMKPHGAPCRSGAKIEASGMAFPRPKTPNAAKRTPQAATGGRSDTTDIFSLFICRRNQCTTVGRDSRRSAGTNRRATGQSEQHTHVGRLRKPAQHWLVVTLGGWTEYPSLYMALRRTDGRNECL